MGRGSELDALKRRIEQLQHGRGTTVLLTGEAGIGKSRLVAEAQAYAAGLGYLVLQGSCFEHDRAVPYAPLIELLRSVPARSLGRARAELLRPFAPELLGMAPELALLWPGRAPETPAPELEKRRIFRSLAGFLTTLVAPEAQVSATTPAALIVIEDLHWCDDSSMECLLHLARQLAGQPLLLLLTYRDNELSAGLARLLAALDREHLAHELALARLTMGETAAMLRAIFSLARAPQADFLGALYELTNGNPFFIEEVLKACVAEGAIFQTGGQWGRKPLGQISIPRTVQFAVQQRVAQLTPAAQQLLTLAAVAGQRCEFDLLLQASGQDEARLIDLIKELVAAQLVNEDLPDQFTFRHSLTRQAVYARLLARERRLLHRTIAEALEQLPTTAAPSASLAYHYAAAGAWEQTLIYARHAGTQAQALQAPQAAAEQWTRALHALAQLGRPAPPELLRARGQAYEQLGEFAAARGDLEAVLALARAAHDSRAEWQALLDLGFLWSGRDMAQAGPIFRQALAIARSLGDQATLAHTLNRVGNWYVNIDRPHQGRVYHEEALAIFTALGDATGAAASIDLLAGALYFGGEIVQGMAYYTTAAEHFRRLDDRRGLVSSLTWLAYRGPIPLNSLVALAPLAACIPPAKEALGLARAIGWRPAEGFAQFALAFCLGAQGEYGRALAAAQAGLELVLELEHAWVPIGRCVLGALYLDLFALTAAQAQLEQARQSAQAGGSVLSQRFSSALMAATYAAQQAFAPAQQLLDLLGSAGPGAAGEEVPLTLVQRLGELVRAQLVLQQGQPAQALLLAERLLADALRQAPDATTQLVPALLRVQGAALAALQRLAEAEHALRQARQAADDQGARAQLWRIEAALGQLYQRQGRREQAAGHFAAARALIDALAASIPDPTLRAGFLAHALHGLPEPVQPSPLQAARQAYDGLTERERAVAALIAQGKSDREIAELLILSKRTVSTHVGNILGKLGFTSRSQIAAWAVAKGL